VALSAPLALFARLLPRLATRLANACGTQRFTSRAAPRRSGCISLHGKDQCCAPPLPLRQRAYQNHRRRVKWHDGGGTGSAMGGTSVGHRGHILGCLFSHVPATSLPCCWTLHTKQAGWALPALWQALCMVGELLHYSAICRIIRRDAKSCGGRATRQRRTASLPAALPVLCPSIHAHTTQNSGRAARHCPHAPAFPHLTHPPTLPHRLASAACRTLPAYFRTRVAARALLTLPQPPGWWVFIIWSPDI